MPSAAFRSNLKLAVAVVTVFVVVAAIAIAAGLVVWSRVPGELRTPLEPILDDSSGLVLVFAAFLLVALTVLVGAAFRAYVGGIARLAEGARVIIDANPAHRLPIEGPAETVSLARLVNELAERQQSTLSKVELRVREANASVEEERRRLAALMSEFTDGVLVCNAEGLILLYNDAARAMFDGGDGHGSNAGGILGLGRSVFGILDRDPIAHALDLVRDRLRRGEPRPVSQFAAATAPGRLIRVRMAPVRGADDAAPDAISGFVLTLDDVTGAVQGAEARDRLLQSLTQDTRAGLASIRAAVETMIGYDAMEPARRDQFIAIIRDEAVRLSERLQAVSAHRSSGPVSHWPLEAMKAHDLIRTLQRSLQRLSGVTANAQAGGEGQWLNVDSFAVVQAFTALAARLNREHDVREFTLALSPGERFTGLEMTWKSPRTDTTAVAAWDQEDLPTADGRGRLSLREVAERHAAEQWWRADRQTRSVTYCMQMPVATDAPSTSVPAPLAERPVFYDFELFDRPDAGSAFEHRALCDLVYTVFDTETTGLDPSAGDEIVSISAVRILNGRLLRNERFDQLVDPRRPLSPESVRIHGITAAMLEGQPTINDVLPRFARFAEDTVLVGHNVAFDMRFLELKERETGQRFVQPVLDTLLLSAVVQPNLREHELEANASRLGIPIIGRHTSLGDAIVTGEIFVRLLPLLAAQGIVTLKDALVASQRTYLARVSY